MKRPVLACVLVAVTASWLGGAGPEAAKTHQVRLGGHTFTLPVGFTIELVAGPPLVDRPIVADFDEQGRLYVADSSGSNEKVDEQLKKKPHRIVRLEDTDGDGKFDRRTVFADKMMFPEGTMWHAGSLYVAAPPSIWKLTDTDGDGVADERVEWFQGKTLTGCANDLHGPYLGPDGWIYWCKGAFAKQVYERPGKSSFVTRAAHVFRARPDGSGVEAVMTGGMDNPVDVVFTPGGERIFTTTFLQTPGGGKRDGLIHAIYGGIYGKDHDPIYEHPWTGPSLMPVLSHMGAAAPCGLVRYESPAFGPEYRDSLFACQFNLHKVSRHVLTPDGATFKSRDEDFLVNDNFDFHPTDVLEDADGSLLVIDTGGWYKLCCPTSQLHKPDILGAIYRVRRTGMPRVEDPRGLKITWGKRPATELVQYLDDARPVVRRRAMQELRLRDMAAVSALNEVLTSARSVEARRNAIWTAYPIGELNIEFVRKIARQALTDPDETVRQVALHVMSVWRDGDALPAVLPLLKNPSPHNRRAAAEALGRMGDKAAVPALLEALSEPNDRALEHSLTFALIEIGDRDGTAVGLKSAHLRVRRAALTALDQMPGGQLDAKAVAAELTSPDAALKETAWWIASRHPEWGGTLTGFLRERLTAKEASPAERDDLVRHLAKLARAAHVQSLLAERLHDPSSPGEARRLVLRAMAQAGLREAPASWISTVTEALAANDSELIREAVTTAKALRLPKGNHPAFASALRQVASNPATVAGVRLTALAAVPGGLTEVPPSMFVFLRMQLAPDQPVTTRGAAADVLSRAKLSPEQLVTLTESLKTVGPLEVDRLLDAFAASSEETVGRNLIAGLKVSPGRSALRRETLRPKLQKFGAAAQSAAEELYALLDADAAMQRGKLDELLPLLKDADVYRGQAVFKSTKAACASCHAIGYLGGNIGPDLTRIGGIRTERDLLESIVFPSSSFVRSYEPVAVTTKAGKIYNGVVRRDGPDELVLALNATDEVRLPRGEIEEVLPGMVSIMPAGLDQQLTPRELADLVAFLKACR